jgi:tetratricopeptide (TPR) repeat protein
LLSQGRAEESLAAITRASELDPLSIVIQMNQPNYYQAIGGYDTMLQLSLGTLEHAPYAITALLNAVWAYLSKGLFDDAVVQSKTIVDLTGAALKGQLGYSYALAGHISKAETILAELKNPPEMEYIRPMQLALVCIGLRQFDHGFDWLERAFEDHTSPLMPFIRQLPMFDIVRDEPRYADIIRRLNFQS